MEKMPKIIPGLPIITLRDHFAIAAMQALVSTYQFTTREADDDGTVIETAGPWCNIEDGKEIDIMATTAYRIADRMVEARDGVRE